MPSTYAWLHCGIPNQALGNNLRSVSIVTVTILQRLVGHGMATYFQIELMLWFLSLTEGACSMQMKAPANTSHRVQVALSFNPLTFSLSYHLSLCVTSLQPHSITLFVDK
jgi:hypothetical protein